MRKQVCEFVFSVCNFQVGKLDFWSFKLGLWCFVILGLFVRRPKPGVSVDNPSTRGIFVDVG